MIHACAVCDPGSSRYLKDVSHGLCRYHFLKTLADNGTAKNNELEELADLQNDYPMTFVDKVYMVCFIIVCLVIYAGIILFGWRVFHR